MKNEEKLIEKFNKCLEDYKNTNNFGKMNQCLEKLTIYKNELINAGYIVRQISDTEYNIKKDDNNFLKIYDNRPKDGKVYKNDCTTRTIQAITGEDYLKIKEEQDKLATDEMDYNDERIWFVPLLKRNYSRINLNKKITRITLIKKLTGFTDKIAAHSSEHVACIDLKIQKVLDTWDSKRGRVDYIFVPNDKKYQYKKVLNA